MIRALLICCCLLACLPASEQPQVDAAVDRGLQALAVDVQAKRGKMGSPGIIGLCGLAFLSGGHTPTRGAHRQACALLRDELLAQQDRITGLWHGHGSYLYDHAFALLFLADATGMSPDRRLSPSVDVAISASLPLQGRDGGWRNVVPGDSDSSVTAAMVQTIRAVENAGLAQQRHLEAMHGGLGFLADCVSADGAIAYHRGGAGNASAPRSLPRIAASAAAMIAAGQENYNGLSLSRSRMLIKNLLPQWLADEGPSWWYGHYYCANVFYYADDPAEWVGYRELCFPTILSLQDQDGHWRRPDGQFGQAYNTAMALIVLQTANAYVPTFQR